MMCMYDGFVLCMRPRRVLYPTCAAASTSRFARSAPKTAEHMTSRTWNSSPPADFEDPILLLSSL
eukprot:2031563-Rhodomonas_salina.2